MRTTANWQIKTPINAIVFDCDGTLSALEGINELAKYNHVSDKVEKLTAIAMGHSGINQTIYQERLNLVSPMREHVYALGEAYFSHRVPDVLPVIQLLKRLNKNIYVVSAGLYPAVVKFAERLLIPKENVFAIEIEFDETGHYMAFDQTSPLLKHDGKRDIIKHLKTLHEEIVHVGDGLNDIVTYDLVTRFIGFGGIFYRENIEKQCKYYIQSPSMTPLLPFILTAEEHHMLTAHEQILFNQGLENISQYMIKETKK